MHTHTYTYIHTPGSLERELVYIQNAHKDVINVCDSYVQARDGHECSESLRSEEMKFYYSIVQEICARYVCMCMYVYTHMCT